MRTLISVALATSLTCACSQSVVTEDTPYIEDGTPEAIGVLGLLSADVSDRAFLDDVVGLDTRAVSHLLSHRDGADRVRGTADDQPFTSMTEVEAVRFVGYAALDTLVDWSFALGFVPGSTPEDQVVDGIVFDAFQGAASLDYANHATVEQLEATGMDRRAVTGIVEARPFPHLWAVGDAWYVGPSALTALRDIATLQDVEITELRFANDLRSQVVDLYASNGDALEADGAVPVAVALAGIHVRRVEVLDEQDPWGHTPDEAALFSHPCTVFPDSKRVWYGAYAWNTGAEMSLYWYEAR